MDIHLKNHLGKTKQCKLGFCWPALFFGFLVPLYRRDFKWAFISFVVFTLLADAIYSYLLIRVCILGLIYFGLFPLLYNQFYIDNLIKKGFIPSDKVSYIALKNKDMINDNQPFVETPYSNSTSLNKPQ